MRNRIVIILLITLLALGCARAEDVAAIVEADADVEITADMIDIEEPALGEWAAVAIMPGSGDADTASSLRTKLAIRATELDYNNYAAMTYSDRARVAIALVCATYTDEMRDYFGEGDAALTAGEYLMYTEPTGEYAVFELNETQWRFAAAFKLSSETIIKRIITVKLSPEAAAPAFIIKREADAWRVVGVNQAYVDLLISSGF